jgi:hypothetical protein
MYVTSLQDPSMRILCLLLSGPLPDRTRSVMGVCGLCAIQLCLDRAVCVFKTGLAKNSSVPIVVSVDKACFDWSLRKHGVTQARGKTAATRHVRLDMSAAADSSQPFQLFPLAGFYGRNGWVVLCVLTLARVSLLPPLPFLAFLLPTFSSPHHTTTTTPAIESAQSASFISDLRAVI